MLDMQQQQWKTETTTSDEGQLVHATLSQHESQRQCITFCKPSLSITCIKGKERKSTIITYWLCPKASTYQPFNPAKWYLETSEPFETCIFLDTTKVQTWRTTWPQVPYRSTQSTFGVLLINREIDFIHPKWHNMDWQNLIIILGLSSHICTGSRSCNRFTLNSFSFTKHNMH